MNFRLAQPLGASAELAELIWDLTDKMNRTEKQENEYLGKVYLVGAGQEIQGLITLKAKGLLECADVVIYDALVSPAILAMINPQSRTN